MKLLMTLLFAALAIALTAGTARASSLQDDVDSMLGTMKTVYSAYYAPAAWKKQYAGYDLNTAYADALAKADTKQQQLTLKQSRVIFKDFIYAMKDYHTSISFTSTEVSSLPITVRGAEGRLFIVEIDRSKLSETAFPFDVGDELLTIDGRKADDIVTELQNYFAANAAATDRATAELRLFRRTAAKGFTDLPSGPVTLELRKAGEQASTAIQLIWDYTPEMIAPRTDFLSAHLNLGLKKSSLLHPRMDVEADLTGDTPDADDPYSLGSHTSFMPNLGARIWESAKDSEFDAYIYMNDDHKLIGYIRIPSYVPGDTMKAIAEFKATISRMEKMTDSLVIDQVNNPGGSVSYLYTLASILTEKPLTTPRHRMAVAQADVKEMLSTLEQLKQINSEDDIAKAGDALQELGEGYPVTMETIKFTRSYCQFIISEWTAGRKLTTPYWIGGVDHITPNPVHYSKPILLLINELDYSGGDFFPTIMQDNKRVTVMGTRTAGAGGYVLDVDVMNNVDIASFRVTASIAERVTGNPIENLGVTPDIAYAMTAADYQSGYAGYVSAVKAALKTITP